MARQKIIGGMMIGAVAGVVLTLKNRETRRYLIRALKHPAETVNQLHIGYQRCSDRLSQGLATTANICQQLEQMINRLDHDE
ncbi:hypothetical protein J416_15312 [Gracilibacillus halophilus YIM-C55.5]|uniref:YtxH domain-containing protein n=1 Tax=Gracilibacillus halophilus YIM-C55.5 TaxID=1308866 RepID=N4W8S4_9BACI|nr:YtxH domain-containing protein [Gracilibacillus halophilus]ENH95604.1 hypothetical protein J416_15312 [Gracilibacillus halophilus YIM-C55.5]